MKIIIGSENKTKIGAVKAHFPQDTVIAKNLPSDVALQPIGDEETMQGAINRATYAYHLSKGGIGFGLEGGIMLLQDQLFLCSWGALKNDQSIYLAAGARIALPPSFKKPLLEDEKELSEVMDAYTKKQNIRSFEGAVGIFTNGQVNREVLFTHIVALLKGQMIYRQH